MNLLFGWDLNCPTLFRTEKTGRHVQWLRRQEEGRPARPGQRGSQLKDSLALGRGSRAPSRQEDRQPLSPGGSVQASRCRRARARG